MAYGRSSFEHLIAPPGPAHQSRPVPQQYGVLSDVGCVCEGVHPRVVRDAVREGSCVDSIDGELASVHTDGLAGATDLRLPLLTFPRAHLDATFGL